MAAKQGHIQTSSITSGRKTAPQRGRWEKILGRVEVEAKAARMGISSQSRRRGNVRGREVRNKTVGGYREVVIKKKKYLSNSLIDRWVQ
jgi:hypothetical protein